MDAAAKERVLERAAELGFDRVGIASGRPHPEECAAFARWVKAGRHADMQFLASRVQRGHLQAPTVISVACAYPGAAPPPAPSDSGSVSRYALPRDYHRHIGSRLKRFVRWLQDAFDCSARACVDTAPVLERAAAVAAGIGFRGRNTCLIAPGLGSWFCLGEILTDLNLPVDEPMKRDCGACRRCIDACPTGALDEQGLDARLCLSYLTIENRGPIPENLRPAVGNRLCGCDTCQAVCPWNSDPLPVPTNPRRLDPVQSLPEILALATHEQFVERFAATPVMRTGRRGLLRNALVVAGNSGDPALLPAIAACADRENDPMLTEHADWARNRLRRTAP